MTPRGPNSGQHQQVRRADSARSKDHLVGPSESEAGAGTSIMSPYSTPTQRSPSIRETVNHRVCRRDPRLGLRQRRRQVGIGGALPSAVNDIQVHRPESHLEPAADVGCTWVSRFDRRADRQAVSTSFGGSAGATGSNGPSVPRSAGSPPDARSHSA